MDSLHEPRREGPQHRSPFRALLSLSDEEAMRRVQQYGDHRAFALLFRRWEGPIKRLCTRMAGDAHRGEELAQEAFTRVFASRGSYRHAAKFSTFLWRVAINLCIDEQRKSRARPELSTGTGEEVGGRGCRGLTCREPPPDRAAADRERAGLVREALMELPEYYRAVVVLRHYEGLKFREIAVVLDIPEGTAKSRMAAALTKLSQILKPVLGQE